MRIQKWDRWLSLVLAIVAIAAVLGAFAWPAPMTQATDSWTDTWKDAAGKSYTGSGTGTVTVLEPPKALAAAAISVVKGQAYFRSIAKDLGDAVSYPVQTTLLTPPAGGAIDPATVICTGATISTKANPDGTVLVTYTPGAATATVTLTWKVQM
jgi:hypothetical protein